MYTRLIDKITLIGAHISGIFILVIVALVFIEVIGRGFFKFSIMICDEISGYLNGALVFLGLAYTMRSGGFIRIEILFNLFHGNVKRLLKWLTCLLSLVYVSILVVYLWRHIFFFYKNKIVSTYFTNLPQFIPLSVIEIGAILLGLLLLGYVFSKGENIP